MPDIELVIKIPKEYYEAIMKIPVNQSTADMLIIKNGKPLPKGHGRLIDADAMWDSYYSNEYDFYEALDDIQTIIEAEKENE